MSNEELSQEQREAIKETFKDFINSISGKIEQNKTKRIFDDETLRIFEKICNEATYVYNNSNIRSLNFNRVAVESYIKTTTD